MGAALPWGVRGWCQGECKVTVPCLWGSEREESICGSRWMMCLELVWVCFIILPAGTSLGLCFTSSMCLGFWWGWGFSGEGREGLGDGWFWVLLFLWFLFFLIHSPTHVLTPTGKLELSRPVDSEWLSVLFTSRWTALFQAKDLINSRTSCFGEKWEVLVTALNKSRYLKQWTKSSRNSVLRGAGRDLWHENSHRKLSRKQTGRPYFILVLIDPYNNFIQR